MPDSTCATYRSSSALTPYIWPAYSNATGPVNYEDSISAEFFVAERKAVFERSWLCVGRSERLPRKGSYFTRELPGRRVIFLTMYEDEEYLLQCLDAGASGYILKDAPAPRLIAAVRDVNAGRKYLSPQVLGKLVDDFRSRSTTGMARGSTLTPREREVIKMLAEGNSVRQIASILGLSVKTVEAHKFNLMRKLNIHNKAQLVTYAIQKKIVKMPAGA